jgi:hypothetical protein
MKPRITVRLGQWLLGFEYCDRWLYAFIGPVEMEWYVGR